MATARRSSRRRQVNDRALARNMANRLIICVSDNRRPGRGLMAVQDGRLVILLISGQDGAWKDLADRLNAEGAWVTVEEEVAGRLAIGRRLVPPGDPLFAAAIVDNLRRERYYVRLRDELRARCWYWLQTLPLDKALRDAIVPALDGLPDDVAQDLLARLEKGATELAEVESRRQGALAEIKIEEESLQQKLVERAREESGGPP